jgi:uncharacterized protein
MTGKFVPEARCAMAVMAKSPDAGAVKTRLVPPLTAAAAAALSAAFLRDTTENIRLAAAAAGPLQGYVAYAPAGIEGAFASMLAAGTRLVLADGSAGAEPGVRGIGRALLHAARSLFAQGHGAVCLVNADSPNLPTAFLTQAAAALAADGDRVVLGPAEDGGYYLIGMKAAHAELFADVAWSTPSVAAATRQRAARLGLAVVELAPWYDVDDAPTLARLCRDLAAPPRPDGLEPYPAPVTAGCLARLGVCGALGTRGRDDA